MNTSTQETPHYHSLQDEGSAALPKGKGSELYSTYFEFHVNMPVVTGVAVSEMSDSELLAAAEEADTFDFLNFPEEDGYNDLLPPRE